MSEVLDLRRLADPFPPDEIEWRVGSTTSNKDRGLALAYLTARHVMDRLDDVCGPEGWQVSYLETPKGRVIATISVKVGSDWISKSDGAGETDVEGEKGAISDALKRAAVPWGIGRYLYTLESPWVEIEPMGRSFKIKESEKEKLLRILKRQTGAPEAKPDPSPPKPKEPERFSKAESRQTYADLQKALDNAETLDALKDRWDNLQPIIKTLPADWSKELATRKDRCKADLTKKAQGLNQIKAPDFSHLEPNDLDPIEELIGRPE